MKQKQILVLAILMSSLVGPNALVSADKGSPQDAQPNASKKGDAGGAISGSWLLNQAGTLVRYARDNESPIAMLTAVQMIRRVPFSEGSKRVGEKRSEAAEQGRPKKEKSKGASTAPSLDIRKLLEEAKPWAKGDKHVLELIEAELSKPASAARGTLGSREGPGVHIDRIQGTSTDVYTITFRGNQLASVGVVGSGNTDLDLYVYDQNGNLVGQDTDATDACIVEWVPRWTGAFRVRIKNLGRSSNGYLLITN